MVHSILVANFLKEFNRNRLRVAAKIVKIRREQHLVAPRILIDVRHIWAAIVVAVMRIGLLPLLGRFVKMVDIVSDQAHAAAVSNRLLVDVRRVAPYSSKVIFFVTCIAKMHFPVACNLFPPMPITQSPTCAGLRIRGLQVARLQYP